MSQFYFTISSLFSWYDTEIPPSHIGSPVQTPNRDIEEWRQIYENLEDWKTGTIAEMPNWALVRYLREVVHPSTRQVDTSTWLTGAGLSGKVTVFPGETIYGIRHYKNYAIDGYGVVKESSGAPLPYAESRQILMRAIEETIAFNKKILLP